ncbi:MAG: type IV-A pilus assembly ATPase PilB [Candidatus Aminicenantes bacterium]|nr:type IV-A pilus assembly ATPase PilB [Candidatus Aminicenantes bacterium]
MGSTLGEVLLKEKILTPEQLRAAQEFQKKHDVPLGSAIVSLNFLSGEEMAQGLSRQLGYPYIDLDQFEVYPDVISLITADSAKKSLVMPIHRIRSFLTLAMVDPTDLDIIEDIRFRTGLSIQPVIASEAGIVNAINKYYGAGHGLKVKKNIEEIELADDTKISVIEQLEKVEEDEDTEVDEDVPDEAPIITLVNNIFVEAIKKGASDVHFEPYEKSFRIRYRIDGVLYETMNLPMKFKNPLTSRVKIMSNMDIAEKRLPQDGRIKMRARMEKGLKKEVDMRISCLPTIFGEKIVARLLDKDNLNIDLNKLGFEQESLTTFQRAIARPWGIILVSGPTGSGKTNTLYSAISTLNGMEKNIMTAEDPVEFYVPGVNQVNIRDEINLTFAAALRAFLRQDPDIMLIGEMRDQETVDIAIKAALTGHLVFSTIHTNDSAATIHRLINMNIEPFLIADSLALVLAQRLIRRVCKKCGAPTKLPVKSLIDMGFSPEEAETVTIMQGRGCEICHNTGYKGRTALFEVMELNAEIREMILLRAQSKDIKKKAVESGMITMRRSGLIKIMAGITTPEEVLRETVKD